MYICIKQDKKRNISYAGNIDNFNIGYAEGIYEIYDTILAKDVKELTDEMTKELSKEGICNG